MTVDPPFRSTVHAIIPTYATNPYLKWFGPKVERVKGESDYYEGDNYYYSCQGEKDNLVSLSLFQEKRFFDGIRPKFEYRRFFYEGGVSSRLELGIRFLKWSKARVKMKSSSWQLLLAYLLNSNSTLKTPNGKRTFQNLKDIPIPLKNLYISSVNDQYDSSANLMESSLVFGHEPSLVIEIEKRHEDLNLPRQAKRIHSKKTDSIFKTYFYRGVVGNTKISVWFLVREKKLTAHESENLRNTRIQILKSCALLQTLSELNNSLVRKSDFFDKGRLSKFVLETERLYFSPKDEFELDFNHFHPAKVGVNSKIIFILKSHFMEQEKEKTLDVDIVILTAIKEEYLAVRRHLTSVHDFDVDDSYYETGKFAIDGEKAVNVVIRECGGKNNVAAQETEKAIKSFSPQVILFVGIAGSRKPQDFGIGDVIFAREIYSYEAGKSMKDKLLPRPDMASSSYTLSEIAKKTRNTTDWKILIKGSWDSTEVKADVGIIASGDQIVEHYNSEIGMILTEHYNDTQAVEMEGFGFAKAALRQGRKASNIMIGVVRGISDVLEGSGKTSEDSRVDRRPSHSKEFASDTAAAFAFSLIKKYFEDPKTQLKSK